MSYSTSAEMTAGQILVVEDELSIRDSIVYALESEGFRVDCATTGNEALERIEEIVYHLVILDVGLPDINGFEVCKALRKSSQVPVIFLTARSSEVDRIVGLEIGADDYVTKPFSPRELSARVRANVRRSMLGDRSVETNSGGVSCERTPFRIDRERWAITYFDQPLVLSRYEFRLLAAFIEKPGRVFSRAQLMDAAWEEPDSSMERAVDTHIKSLRAKLKECHSSVDPIVTHRGIGYSLREHW